MQYFTVIGGMLVLNFYTAGLFYFMRKTVAKRLRHVAGAMAEKEGKPNTALAIYKRLKKVHKSLPHTERAVNK